jgi:hypothetical protein
VYTAVNARLTPVKKVSSDTPIRSVRTTSAASDGTTLPLSTAETNDRVNGSPVSAWLRP